MDVKFRLIAHNLIKHYCFKSGEWEKKTIYTPKNRRSSEKC